MVLSEQEVKPMKLYGKAREAIEQILSAFESGRIPEAMAQVFIRRSESLPCRKWSPINQLLMILNGYSDARGVRQWNKAGRKVKKGAKAFYILCPVLKEVEKEEKDKQTGRITKTTRIVPVAFKSVPVFGYEQTEGEPVVAGAGDQEWIKKLPLIEVAEKWGISVSLYDGRGHYALGMYSGSHIHLGVENLSTWTHELIHAADDRVLLKHGERQRWAEEIVAELGGAVLLELLGYKHQSDRGGAWQYISSYAESAQLDSLTACRKVFTRTCAAVAYVLEEAEAIAKKEVADECPTQQMQSV